MALFGSFSNRRGGQDGFENRPTAINRSRMREFAVAGRLFSAVC
jgi:hypothetical protein